MAYINIFNGTNPIIVGATVYALNLTHGLAPARPIGEDETVVAVLDSYSGLIETDKGNVYGNGNFGIRRYNGVEREYANPDESETYAQERRFIDAGYSVTMVGYDPSRDVYAFGYWME